MEISCLLNFFLKMCQSRHFPTQDHGESKRELCHHHGNRQLVDSFLPGVTETQPSYPRSWRVQEGALPSSWRLTATRFFYSHTHGESKRDLCHHHGISQKHLFDLVISLFACVLSLYIYECVYLSFRVVKISVVSNGTPIWNSVTAHIVPIHLIRSLFTYVQFFVCERDVKSWNALVVSTYILFGLPNPVFSIREIVALCMGESDIPNLRLWSPRLTKKCRHVRDMVDF